MPASYALNMPATTRRDLPHSIPTEAALRLCCKWSMVLKIENHISIGLDGGQKSAGAERRGERRRRRRRRSLLQRVVLPIVAFNNRCCCCCCCLAARFMLLPCCFFSFFLTLSLSLFVVSFLWAFIYLLLTCHCSFLLLCGFYARLPLCCCSSCCCCCTCVSRHFPALGNYAHVYMCVCV